VILELNPGALIHDQGSYLRVSVQDYCILTSDAVEKVTGGIFRLPGDLESVMPSFKGEKVITENQATRKVRRRKEADRV
jgi:hypothetical protein